MKQERDVIMNKQGKPVQMTTNGRYIMSWDTFVCKVHRSVLQQESDGFT